LKELESISNQAVREKFLTYPDLAREKLLKLRELILKVASETEGVGELEETLKWQEPSYLTSQTKSGSTIRIDWKKSTADYYGIYFNCKTTLVDEFKELFGSKFSYQGNRSILLELDKPLPTAELKICIAMTLTYHRNKKMK
jgi:hypothetical protein